MIQGPVANAIKLFMVISYDFHYKLEHMALASLSSLVLSLQVRQEPTQWKPLSGSPL
jgi:hypothetical protein